jgi:hypothetical protein
MPQTVLSVHAIDTGLRPIEKSAGLSRRGQQQRWL